MKRNKNTFHLGMIEAPRLHPTASPSKPGWMEGGSGDRSLGWDISLSAYELCGPICKMGNIYLKEGLCKSKDDPISI